MLEATGKAAGDGAIRRNRLSGIFACCSDVILDDSQRAASEQATAAAGGGGVGGMGGGGNGGGVVAAGATPPSKWRVYNAADMATLGTLNVHEALRQGMAAAGAQAGTAFQAAMGEVDPHLAAQIVQLGLGGGGGS